MTAGHARATAGRAGGLGIHPHEVDALGCETVHVRRLIAAHFLDRRNANVADRAIVPHDVNDIGRSAKLFAQLGQLLVEFLIFGRPRVAVLSIEDVILGVVDNFGFANLSVGRLIDNQEAC